MTIETVSDLAEQIADWLCIYGNCKSTGDEGCEYDENKPPFCCRQGFVMELQERIVAAVENDKKLEATGLTGNSHKTKKNPSRLTKLTTRANQIKISQLELNLSTYRLLRNAYYERVNFHEATVQDLFDAGLTNRSLFRIKYIGRMRRIEIESKLVDFGIKLPME